MECQIERKIIDMVERQFIVGKAREGDVKDIALVRIGIHCANEAGPRCRLKQCLGGLEEEEGNKRPIV